MTFFPDMESLVLFILVASIKASILILVILGIRAVLKKHLSIRARYWLWFTLFPALISPFGFQAELPVVEAGFLSPVRQILNFVNGNNDVLRSFQDIQFPDSGNNSTKESPAVTDTAFDNPVQARTGQFQPSSVPVPDQVSWLTLIWFSGLTCYLGALGFFWYRFNHIVALAGNAPAELTALLESCRKEINLKRAVKLKLSSAVDTPCVSGVFRPVLLLPEESPRYLDGRQLRHVFLHELIHVKHNDIAVNWLASALQCLHWFNPLVWLAFRMMRNDRENVCDMEVLVFLGSNERFNYGDTLVKINSSLPLPTLPTVELGMTSSAAQLRSRLEMICNPRRGKRSQKVLSFLVLSGLTSIAFTLPAVPEPPEIMQASIAPQQSVNPGTLPREPEIPAVIVETLPVLETTVVEVVAESELSAPEPPLPLGDIPSVSRLPSAVTTSSINPVLPPEEAVVVTPMIIQVIPEAVDLNTVIMAALEQVPESDSVPLNRDTGIADDSRSTEQQTEYDSGHALLETSLSAEFEAVQAETQEFVSEWNDKVAACNKHSRIIFFGNLSGSCIAVRAAIRRKVIPVYIHNCYSRLDKDFYWAEVVNRLEELDAKKNSQLSNMDATCSLLGHEDTYPAFSEFRNNIAIELPGERIINWADSQVLHHDWQPYGRSGDTSNNWGTVGGPNGVGSEPQPQLLDWQQYRP